MTSISCIKRDHLGGTLMVLVGLTAIVAGLRYQTGTLNHMGSGFFPVALGTLLALVGFLIAVTANRKREPDAEPSGHQHGHGLPDLRGAACILAGAVSFVFIGMYGGLIPATFSIVFISSLGDRSNTVRQAALLAMAMCAVAAVVFSWALQLQLPLFAWGA